MIFENKYHHKELSDYSFLITGGAGFIGSNIVEYLLKHNVGQVTILDNFATGHRSNIEKFLDNKNCRLIEGDIRNLSVCKEASRGVDYILHQAALGSVPRSINDPITSNEVNVSGFLNMLIASKEEDSVKRLVYAASSSTYGDSKALPKKEEIIGNPLSPYAVTKYVNELYADVFGKTYGIDTIGLRYFNVFGPKQDPNGAYAAVIPKFVGQLLKNENLTINGNGEHSRDFTFIENVVQANIKAAFSENRESANQVYNVAFGENIDLNELVKTIKECLQKNGFNVSKSKIINGTERIGDVKHSLADISKAKRLLEYNPLFNFNQGIAITTKWFCEQLK